MLLSLLKQHQILIVLGQKFSIYQTVSKAYVFDNLELILEINLGIDYENPITLKNKFYKRGFLMKSFISSIMI